MTLAKSATFQTWFTQTRYEGLFILEKSDPNQQTRYEDLFKLDHTFP